MLLIFKLIIGITTALLIGGCVCFFVNKDKGDPCYITLGLGLSFSLGIVVMSIFFCIIEYLDPAVPTSQPLAISSGPILPLSSLPSAPSKILVIRTKP